MDVIGIASTNGCQDQFVKSFVGVLYLGYHRSPVMIQNIWTQPESL
jgi:hypothetical protein